MPINIVFDANFALIDGIQDDLRKINFLGRNPSLRQGFKAAADIVKKRLRPKLPAPQYRGDRTDLDPIKHTVRSKNLLKSRNAATLVGYDYPRGAHGHWLEVGHIVTPNKRDKPRKSTPRNATGEVRIYATPGYGGKTKAFRFLKNASEETLSAQRAAISKAVVAAIPKGRP